MNHHSRSHRMARTLLAFCLISITLGLSLFFPPPPRAHAATITVQSSADGPADSTQCPGSGCRLRDAIAAANPAGGDIIDFSLTYPATITLTSGELVITTSLTINGPGASSLTISGGNATRVISVTSGITMNLSNVTIANGNATSGYGGGIYNLGTLMITSTTLFSNSASFSGGGIYNTGTAMLVIVTLDGNFALYGGGIYNEGGVLMMTNGTVYSNTASIGGGGGIINSGALTISNTTVYSNSALTAGGGIYNAGTSSIINTTLSANSASGGGGIYNDSALTVTNSTLSANSAGAGGGIYNNFGTVTLRNTIVANSLSAANCIGSITNGGNNLQFGGTSVSDCGVGIPIANPKLGPLANNGGSTKTMALLPGSPAIDAGNDALCPPTDQRGAHRPFGPHCDIGAYERGAYLYLPLILK